MELGEQSPVPDRPPGRSFMYQNGVDPAELEPAPLNWTLHHGPTPRLISLSESCAALLRLLLFESSMSVEFSGRQNSK